MRCQAWTLTGSTLRANKVSPVAAVSRRWKSAVTEPAVVSSLATSRGSSRSSRAKRVMKRATYWDWPPEATPAEEDGTVLFR